MAIKNTKTRASISLDKSLKDFLDYQSTVEVRSVSNIITKLLLDNYQIEYKEFMNIQTDL